MEKLNNDLKPDMISRDAILKAQRDYGLVMFDLDEGDLIYFPSQWYHEVYYLDKESLSTSNAVFNHFYKSSLCTKTDNIEFLMGS